MQHRWCIEAAVVSIAHEIKGETIVAFAKLDARRTNRKPRLNTS